MRIRNRSREGAVPSDLAVSADDPKLRAAGQAGTAWREQFPFDALSVVGVDELHRQSGVCHHFLGTQARQGLKGRTDVQVPRWIELTKREGVLDVVGELPQPRLALLQRGLQGALLGDVPDCRDDDRVRSDSVRAQTDFDRERGAVSTPSMQRQPGPRLPRL